MIQGCYEPLQSRYEPPEVNMCHPVVDISHPKVVMSLSHYEPLHWSVVIISNLPFSLTRRRGEYLRVVGILEMVE